MEHIQIGDSKQFDSDDRDFDKRSFFMKATDCILRRKKHFARSVYLTGSTFPKNQSYPANVVRNQKYHFLTFLPVALYEQFKFFFNFYYLIITLTQFIPILQVGFLFTYVAPLAFVMGVTLLKEAFDDLKRMKRDYDANSQQFEKLTENGTKMIPSSSIKVGDMILLNANQRVPADCVLLHTTEKTGASFIRTDQLDGETDWKLRRPIASLQKLQSSQLHEIKGYVYAEKPKKEIYDFVGNFTTQHEDGSEFVEPLNLENTLWANTVIATGTVVGLVVYSGSETKSALNTSSPSSKIGLLDLEINFFSKLLFVLMLILSFIMIAVNLFRGNWFITFFRFLLLFSSIIPISMRVNLDMGKTLYSFFIMRDPKIKDTIVRNSSIPEELGRISHFFTDKTGTLTQNDMIFKKLVLAQMSFTHETLADIGDNLIAGYSNHENKVYKLMNAIALCHNVTPTTEGDQRVLQASSPDEVALVKFSESVNLFLQDRDLTTITLKTPIETIEHYEVLQIFPFTSESKRMGIIVQNKENGQIVMYVKGADVIMSKIVKSADWLSEECDNLARSGLRTLVFGQKILEQHEYDEFVENYRLAKATLQNRQENMNTVREELEKNLELLGITGVEDKLQEDVATTIENLRNAGIAVWMLTGDKIETATCIARSTKLVSRNQNIFYLLGSTPEECSEKLDDYNMQAESCLILDGSTLQICVDHLKDKFCGIAQKAPCVVCCRCSPTQKAVIVEMIRAASKKRVAAIGDGGNDVSMILAANVGIGIVGKEGKHASLAADFSITQFSFCQRLILWHGRNSYKRSARLSQFVIHRGLIISIIQALFSAIFYFAAIPIFTGWLMVGYSTIYTMVPVFAIVLDMDVSEDVAFRFPELYKELQKGRSLNVKTFFSFVFKAVYQGGVIMLLSLLLFENSFQRIVSITFTALIVTELLMVQIEVHRHCNPWIILANVFSIFVYVGSMFLLPSYFDMPFVLSLGFLWRVLVIIVVSLFPVYIVKLVINKINPPSYTKL